MIRRFASAVALLAVLAGAASVWAEWNALATCAMGRGCPIMRLAAHSPRSATASWSLRLACCERQKVATLAATPTLAAPEARAPMLFAAVTSLVSVPALSHRARAAARPFEAGLTELGLHAFHAVFRL